MRTSLIRDLSGGYTRHPCLPKSPSDGFEALRSPAPVSVATYASPPEKSHPTLAHARASTPRIPWYPDSWESFQTAARPIAMMTSELLDSRARHPGTSTARPAPAHAVHASLCLGRNVHRTHTRSPRAACDAPRLRTLGWPQATCCRPAGLMGLPRERGDGSGRGPETWYGLALSAGSSNARY